MVRMDGVAPRWTLSVIEGPQPTQPTGCLEGRAIAGPVGLETTGTHTPTETYSDGVITLDPLHVTDQLTPSTNFMQVLLAEYPASSGWSFVNSASELSDNSLVVRTYHAFGATHMVGAMIHIQFDPHSGDPTHSTHDIHWIQVVTDNHNMTDNPGHGNPENTVDINEGINHHTTPYYDEGFTANAGQFGDRSDRWDGDAAPRAETVRRHLERRSHRAPQGGIVPTLLLVHSFE